MSYELAMGTEFSTEECRTADQIRQRHNERLAELEEGNATQQARAQAAREAVSLTDEQLDARRRANREEERRAQEAVRAASGTPAYATARAELDRVRNEWEGLQLEWMTRDRAAREPEQCARAQEREREVENMWASGQWRDHDVYNRWLERKFVSINPLRYYLGVAHCAVVGPSGGTDSRCAGYMPPNRPLAIGLTVLPFATGYWAWKKKDGSLPWTAAGAVVGVVGPVLAWALLFYGMLSVGGSVRY
jgi:hypothetical protein